MTAQEFVIGVALCQVGALALGGAALVLILARVQREVSR